MVGFSARSRRDRAGIESRFPGTVTYHDRPEQPAEVLAARTASVGDQSGAGLGFCRLRASMMTTHDLAKRESRS